MAIGDDFSIADNGDIRYTGTTANYTVIAFHRWLGDLMDDAQASGNDVLDITDATASDRSTDNIITLNSPYNIDDVAAEHLYDGSINQDSGNTIYDGIVVFAPAGTALEIIQNESLVSPNFWGTGLNADATQGISHRFMVKVRSGGADIDGKKLIGYTRELGNTYSTFTINSTSNGNNVIALSKATDLNNATTASTIKGWTTITNTTEGYALIDVNNDTTNEPYYSEWNRASQTINDLYERMKYISQEPVTEDSNSDTGSAFQLGNATITGQAQSFSVGANPIMPIRARFELRKVGSPTGNITCNVYAHSGTFGSSSVPTGGSLVASATYDSSLLTTSYKTIEFEFPVTTVVELSASTNYVISLEKAVGDGSNYVEVEGLATSGTHAGNRSQEVGTWSAAATDDLGFVLQGSMELYGLAGCLFRGITHEWDVDGILSGPLSAFERITWAGGTGQMIATDSVSAPTKVWLQLLSGSVPGDNITITGATSGATFLTEFTGGASTERPIATPFVGASTGSALIGAYGFGVESADLAVADSVIDLTDTTRNPPNNVTFSVGGLVSGEDRVLVAPLGYYFAYDNEASGPFTLGETLTFTSPAGTATLQKLQDDGTTGFMWISEPLSGSVPQNNSTIAGATATADVNGTVSPEVDVRQMDLDVALTGATETAVDVNAIPVDTPQTGEIRIQLDSGIYREIAYTSWTGSVFTIASTDFTGANQAAIGNGVYIAYIDKLATTTPETFQLVYNADRNLFIRVRDGGTAGDGLSIKTFETSGTLTTAGGSTTAIRTSDE